MIKFILALLSIALISCTFSNILKTKISANGEASYENQINLLNQELLHQLKLKEKIKLAVLDFTMLDGSQSVFCKLVAADLTYKLHSSDKIELIERNMINKVIEEHKFNLSGFVDENTIKEIGQISGVDAIVTGSIAKLNEKVRISARIIATDTGKVLSASTVNILIDEEIKALIQSDNKNSNISLIIKEAEGFQINLIKSEQIESSVFVFLEITNVSNNLKKCTIGYGNPYSKIFDTQGNEYLLREVKIGNKLKKFHKGGSRYQSFSKEIPVNIPTQVKLTFDGVFSNIKEIQLLKVHFGNAKRVINFYNIPLKS